MNRRMIDSSMWQNERFAEMPMGARLLQIGMINHADDQGRLKANPAWLRAQIFPYDNMDVGEVQSWLDMMAQNETIILYTVAGKQYAQLCNWWKYQSLQYAQPSQFPRPAGWLDRIRKTVTKGFIATCNWITVDGSTLADTCDMDGNVLNTGGRPSTVQPPPSTPITPSVNGHSPESSPESSPEDTILTKLNINKNYHTTTRETIRNESEEGGSGGGELPFLASAEPEPIAEPGKNTKQPPNRQANPEYAQICTAFETNGFGTLTPILGEQIADMLDEYPVSLILSAMHTSVSANKRQLRYVAGVLRRWRADGVDPSTPRVDAPKPAGPIVVQADAGAAALLAQLWQPGGQDGQAAKCH